MRRHGYRGLEIDGSASPQRAHARVREEVEPNHENAQGYQDSTETASMSKDETFQPQEESETTSQDGKPNTEEVVKQRSVKGPQEKSETAFRDGAPDSEEMDEQRSIKSPQSPQSLSMPHEQHLEREEGLEMSRHNDRPPVDTTSKERPNSSCCTM